MKTEFTPSPWILNSNAECIAVAYKGKSFVAVWHCSFDETTFPAEANANLIAAAPDLYAALESALNNLHNNGMSWTSTYKSGQLALAKARGENL